MTEKSPERKPNIERSRLEKLYQAEPSLFAWIHDLTSSCLSSPLPVTLSFRAPLHAEAGPAPNLKHPEAAELKIGQLMSGLSLVLFLLDGGQVQ